MGGRGGYHDNIFIGRIWRSLEYETLYRHERRDGLDAGRVIGSWIEIYNEAPPHSSSGGRAPEDEARDGREAASGPHLSRLTGRCGSRAGAGRPPSATIPAKGTGAPPGR